MENENRLSRCCCFTGHRPEKLDMSERLVKSKLKKAIIDAVNDGYIVFISGMARGVDIWAAEIVLKERKKNSDIKLVCASPYEGFEHSWENLEKRNTTKFWKRLIM